MGHALGRLTRGSLSRFPNCSARFVETAPRGLSDRSADRRTAIVADRGAYNAHRPAVSAPRPSAFIGVHLRLKFLRCRTGTQSPRPRKSASKDFQPRMNADERG